MTTPILKVICVPFYAHSPVSAVSKKLCASLLSRAPREGYNGCLPQEKVTQNAYPSQLTTTNMKSFYALAALVAGAVAQRLTIFEPAIGGTVSASSPFIVELHQDVGFLSPIVDALQLSYLLHPSFQQSTSDIAQVNVVIAVTPCFDVCDDPSQWGLGTVLYNGAFNPQDDTTQPQKGLHQDFNLTLPEGWPTGESVIGVAHLLNIGVCARLPWTCFESLIHRDGPSQAVRTPSFDYSEVHVEVV